MLVSKANGMERFVESALLPLQFVHACVPSQRNEKACLCPEPTESECLLVSQANGMRRLACVGTTMLFRMLACVRSQRTLGKAAHASVALVGGDLACLLVCKANEFLNTDFR